MRFDDIQPLDEAPKKPAGGAGAFGQMGNTLSGANKSKSSTGGTITRTPTGLVHTAKPGADKPKPTPKPRPKPGADKPKPTPKPGVPPAAGSANTDELTKAWIQYLKNNQIVALQSDPKTGKLTYKKKVTTDNLSQFLQSETSYDKGTINNVIQSVITGTPLPPAPKPGAPAPTPAPKPGVPPKPGAPATTPAPKPGAPATTPAPKPGAPAQAPKPGAPAQAPKPGAPATTPAPKPGAPAQAPKPGAPAQAPKPKSKEEIAKDLRKQEMMKLTRGRGLVRDGDKLKATVEDPDDPTGETDINLEYDEDYNLLNKSKRNNVTGEKIPESSFSSYLPKSLRKNIIEAIVDKPTEVKEKDVQSIFSTLLSQAPSGASAEEPAAAPTEPAPEDAEKKAADVAKLKNLIGTGMTPAQRKELWTSLKGTALSESGVDRREAIQILKYAAKIKHTIKLEDLQASWSKAGYPTDLDEIAKILNKAGFGRTDIKDIFDEVIGDDGSEDYEDEESGPSPTIIKIIDYINKNGIKDDILAYMEEEFGDELNAPEPEKKGWFDKVKDFGKRIFTREATVKEIEQIFTKILLKERTELPMRIKEQEQRSLGRKRK